MKRFSNPDPDPAPTAKCSRRILLKVGLGLLGTASLTRWGSSLIPTVAATEATAAPAKLLAGNPGIAKTTLTPDQAMQKLLQGNQRFVSSQRQQPHQDKLRLAQISQGQAPFASILSCADSRVVPEILFDQGMGDLFVVRVAGNITTDEELASQEYAIAELGVPLLLVLGHERCGAVTAALAGGELPGHLNRLVEAIQPAIAATANQAGDRLTNVIQTNVRLQVQRLQTSLIIAAAVQAGKLKVIGAYYDLDTGSVSLVK